MKNFDSKETKVGTLKFTEYFLNNENAANQATNILKENFHNNTIVYEIELSSQDWILFERETINIKKFSQKYYIDRYLNRSISLYSTYLCYFEVESEQEIILDLLLKKYKNSLLKILKKCYSPFDEISKNSILVN